MDEIKPINGLYDLSDVFKYIFALPYGLSKGYHDKSAITEYMDNLYDKVCADYQKEFGGNKNEL